MPLQPTPLALQFAGGVETKQDSKQVPIAKLIDLQNCTFIKTTTLAKRNGYEALSKRVDVLEQDYGTGVGLAARNDELVLFDGQRAVSYRDSSNTWSDCGNVGSVVASDITIARSGTQQSNADHGSNGGVTVVAWEDSRGGIWASVVEQTTGRILKAEAQVDATGLAPRVLACGANVLLLWVNGTAINVVVVNPALPTTAFAPALLTNDISPANQSYDACTAGGTLYSSIGPGLIVWAQNGGGFRVGYLHPSGVLGSPATGLPTVVTWADAVNGPVSCSYDKEFNSSVGLVWYSTATGANIRFLNPADLSIDLGDFQEPAGISPVLGVVRCAGEFAGTSNGLPAFWWAVERVAGVLDQNSIATGGVTNDGADIVPFRALLGHGLLSRAFHDGSDAYVTVAHSVKFFPYVAVVRLSATQFGGTSGTQAFARVLPGLSTGLGARHVVTSSPPLSPSASFLSRQHALTLGYRIQLSSKNGDQFGEAGMRLLALDFNDDAAYQATQLGQGLYLAGACMSHYDGSRWAEAGFHCAPDTAAGTITTVKAGGGALTPGQTYLYIACYEETDNLGEIHQGAASAPITVVMGGGDSKVTLTLPTCRLTKRAHARIGVYRSVGNATGSIDQIEFFRVTSTDPNSAAGNNRYVINDPTVDSVSFVDIISDATLITLEPLYTNGGIRSNDPTPCAGDAIAGGKSRLFWTDPSDPNMVRFSQERADETAADLSLSLSLRVDPYGGRIVGLGVLDDAIIVFKATAIYRFAGPGPAAAPDLSQDAFSPAQLLTSDVGCKAPRSICPTPVGITFQSSKGIMLLGRDGSVNDIGAAVYTYNSQTIVRATLLPDRHQVVFLTNAGRTLLFDYERQQWSTYTNHEGVDAVVVEGVYHYLRTDGRVFAETPGVYRDDNAHIPMLIETAWVKLTGYLQGWQSILWAYFVGTYLSEHTLRMRYRIDYQDAYSAPIDMNVNSNYNPSLYGAGLYGAGPYGGAGGSGTVYQRRKHLNKKCQSISFRIEDVEATDSYGAAFQLSELLLIGGVLDTKFKPGAARSA